MGYELLYRPAEVIEGGWQSIGSGSDIDDADDAVESWQGVSPSHGDLLRVVATNGQRIRLYFEEIDSFEAIPPRELLYVFDVAKSAFSLVTFKAMPPKKYREGASWVSLWEGPDARSDTMFSLCDYAGDRIDKRRLTLAACAVVEPALNNLASRYERWHIAPRKALAMAALEAAKAWCRGEATLAQVKSAILAIDLPPGAEYANLTGAIRHAASVPLPAAYRGDDTAARRASAAAHGYAYGRAQLGYEVRNFLSESELETSQDSRLAEDASLVRRYIPLSVLACSLVGARDPLPMPRENPSRALGWIANPTTSRTAPAAVRREFARGLDLLRRGMGGDGLRGETVQWAERLARGEPATPEKLRLMRAWFARHGASPLEADARHRQANQIAQGAPPRRAPALVAWLLWGGDAGRSWASQMAPRGNPTFLDHCVEKVGATTDASLLSQREGKSRAYAICTASFQKAGYYRRKADGFSRTLTRAGTLAEQRHRRHSKD